MFKHNASPKKMSAFVKWRCPFFDLRRTGITFSLEISPVTIVARRRGYCGGVVELVGELLGRKANWFGVLKTTSEP